MRKGILRCEVTILIFLLRVMDIICGNPCPSGTCPMIHAPKYPYLDGKYECGVCGSEKSGTKPECHLIFVNFRTLDSSGCILRDDYCLEKKCKDVNTTRCEEVYLRGMCCICKKNVFGDVCDLPPVIKVYGDLIDIRDRPECWVQFHHHVLPWRSGPTMASIVMVARKEMINELPFLVILSDVGRIYYITKFTMKITKGEHMNWCLTSTNLGDYCKQFSSIFDPKYGRGTEVKHLVFFESEFDFIHTRPQRGYVNTKTYTRNDKVIGIDIYIQARVYPFTLKAPYFRLPGPIWSNDISFTFGDIFSNQTAVDGTCVPWISQLCQIQRGRTAAFPYETRSIKMEYHRPPSECQESSIEQWKVFKVSTNMFYMPGDEIFTREGCCTLTVPPYTLAPGNYFIKLTMMHIQNGNKIYNSKYCYQSISNDGIKAHFNAMVKVVNTEDSNKVEVDAKDINRPPKEQKKDLVYIWSCKFNGTDEPCTALDKLFKNAPSIEFPPKILKVNSSYNFTVQVHSTVHVISQGAKSDTSATVYQQLIVTTLEPSLITLHCVTCDESQIINTQESNIIAIRAKDGKNPPIPADYEWRFAGETGGVVGEFHPVVDIREESGTTNIVLKIKNNALDHHKVYVFQVRVPNSKVFAQITVRTSALNPFMEKDLNCTLDPKEGIRGWTDFNVECIFEDESLLFEFFDKEEKDEHVFSGRMLGYNDFGTLNNFKMTKGKFFVLVFDKNSVTMNYTLIVPLVPFDDTLKYLEELLNRAQEFTEFNQFDWPSATVSSVADVTEREMNPPAKAIKQPVLIINRVHLSDSLQLGKMVLSSLKIVLTNTASKFDILELDAHMTKIAADILLDLTLNLMKHEQNMAGERTLPRTVFFDMIKSVFDCAEILLLQKNREFRSKPEKYTNPFINDLVQQTYTALVSVLDTASYSLNRQQIPEDSAKEIVSDREKLLASTKVDFAGDLSNWTVISENISVVISSKLISSVGSTSVLGLQYIRMRVNPFWWAGGNIVSEVLLVNLCLRIKVVDCLKLTRFKDFVTLRLSVIEPLSLVVPIEGTAYQVDPKTIDENKELELTVYRFFLPKRAKLFIKFILNDTQEYRIMLTEGHRPDYASMIEHPNVINTSSPDYNVPYGHKQENEKVYYMGILPSGKVGVGERVPFRFKAFYSLCNTWVRWHWTIHGCWAGAETNEESIHCDCDYLRNPVVAGAISTPDHNLSTVTEFLLFLTPWVNLLPLFILLLIVLVFLLLLIWAVIKDRKGRRGGEVIVLDDNFPGDPYAYLLGVYTGSSLNSGTSAAVGVRLIGDADESRLHILRSPDRSVMNGFSEDWFLIYSPRYLGKLSQLLLWHNDEGSSPDWFVETVEVYDLQTNIQYIFKLNTWISLEVDAYPDAFISPVEESEYLSTMNIFWLNFANGVRDTHIWTSVCLKHPRNPVSRVERVNVVMCFVLSAMAVCLLLYMFHFGFYIDEDKPSYYLTTTDLFIFILTLIAASIMSCLTIGLFRKSFTRSYKAISQDLRMSLSQAPNERKSVRYRYSEDGELTALQQEHINRRQSARRSQIRNNPRQRRIMCERCVMALHKIAQGNSLQPIQLPDTKSDLIVRKPWFITAWIICITTILLSVLIIIFNAWFLPTVKDEQFLTVFLGVVIFDAVIISFLKILLFSLVLSYKFQNIVPGTKYHIDIEDGKRLHLFGNEPFLTNLLDTRKKSIYYSLPESVKENKRQNKIRKQRWRMMIEFVILVTLLCLISAVCNIYYINRYRSNSHAAAMITTSESTRIPNLQKVLNRTELYSYLETTYVSQLYRFMWYNYKPLLDHESGREDWTNDCIMRLLGNTRIRQLRVSLHDCRVSGYFRDSIKFCARPWSRAAEDKDVYSTSWLLAEYKDKVRKVPTWRYTEAGSSNSSSFYGPSGTLFHGGGYIAELGYSKRGTRASLVDLEMKGWLDHMTRVVFVELTLYNVNTELFTQVVLVCEQHPSGQYISMPKAESVTINIGFTFWAIVFIIFQLLFLFRELYLMNRHGVCFYLSSTSNKYKIVLLVIGFAMVVLYVVHVKLSSFYVEEYRRKELDQFFSFYKIIKYDFLSKAAMCFLFVCVVMNLLLCWKFGWIYHTFYYTFVLSWSLVFWLTLYFTIFLIIIWRFIGYRMSVYIFSTYSIIIIYPKDFKITRIHDRWKEHLVVYLMCIMSYLLVVLFIASFTNFYRVAKIFKPYTYEEINRLNYVTFLKIEIKRLFGRDKQLD